MPTVIDRLANVSPGAELGEGVVVGPYATIEDKVVIGEGTHIDAHVVVKSNTTIGKNCRIHPYASIGTDPQDLSYRGEDTYLVIGDNNIIREFTTLNRGSVKGGGVTRIGNSCMIMAYAHVAHDCQLGNNVIMTNMATIAGHVRVEDYAYLSAAALVHQFCRIGTSAFITGTTAVILDVPPYCMADGRRALLVGLNKVGMQRRGMPEEAQQAVKDAFKLIFRQRDGVMAVRLARAEEIFGHVPEVKRILDFIKTSERGICRYTKVIKRSD